MFLILIFICKARICSDLTQKADWKYKLKSFFIIIISPIKNDLIIGCPHWFHQCINSSEN